MVLAEKNAWSGPRVDQIEEKEVEYSRHNKALGVASWKQKNQCLMGGNVAVFYLMEEATVP